MYMKKKSSSLWNLRNWLYLKKNAKYSYFCFILLKKQNKLETIGLEKIIKN